MYAGIARVPIEQMFLAGVVPARAMVARLLLIGGFLRQDKPALLQPAAPQVDAAPASAVRIDVAQADSPQPSARAALAAAWAA